MRIIGLNGTGVTAGLLAGLLILCTACTHQDDRTGPRNSLHQETGAAGSTVSKEHPPYYPNTSGNIVAPPGNPGGNPAGEPPIVGGTLNQRGGWPQGR